MEFEKDIEKYLCKKVDMLGGRCVKWGVSGEPDRIIFLKGGRCAFVELKREDGRLSELQKVKVDRLRDLGFTVYVPYSKKDVDKLIEDVMR